MGVLSSKHINIDGVPEVISSQEFILQRKQHYQNEYSFVKSRNLSDDDSNILNPAEHSNAPILKHATFLEPHPIHSDKSKEDFRRRSIQIESKEFTFAKEHVKKKKKKETEQKKCSELREKNSKNRKKEKMKKRNKSHEQSERDNPNVS